jgi:hypothetical protein
MVNNASYIIECQEADRSADPWNKVICAVDWQTSLIFTTGTDCYQWQCKFISSHKLKIVCPENKMYEENILKFMV